MRMPFSADLVRKQKVVYTGYHVFPDRIFAVSIKRRGKESAKIIKTYAYSVTAEAALSKEESGENYYGTAKRLYKDVQNMLDNLKKGLTDLRQQGLNPENSENYIVLSLPQISTKFFSIPKNLPDKQASKIITAKIQEDKEWQGKSYAMDWDMLSFKGELSQVMTVLASQEFISSLTEIFKGLNFLLDGIESSSTAILRTLGWAKMLSEDPVAFLHLGEREAIMNVLTTKDILYTRNIAEWDENKKWSDSSSIGEEDYLILGEEIKETLNHVMYEYNVNPIQALMVTGINAEIDKVHPAVLDNLKNTLKLRQITNLTSEELGKRIPGFTSKTDSAAFGGALKGVGAG